MKKTFEELLPVFRMIFCLIGYCKLIGPNGKTLTTERSDRWGLHDYVFYNILPNDEDVAVGYWPEWCSTQYGAFKPEIDWDGDEDRIDFKEPGWEIDPKVIEDLRKYAADTARIYQAFKDATGLDLQAD